MCANTAALNNYLKKQDDETNAYNDLLDALRAEDDIEKYDDIIKAHGFEDVDYLDILKDI